MRKTMKIGLSILGVCVVAGISLISIVSCSSNSNKNSSDSKSNSSSTSSSSSSGNLSYIPYSDLTTTVIKNGDSDSAWTYATALSSWQKIFASYNYKDAVESALNSFLNDYANYETEQAINSLKTYNTYLKKYNLSASEVITVSNSYFSYNSSNDTVNLSYTISENDYYTNLQNNKSILAGQYTTNVSIVAGQFGAGLDSYNINFFNGSYGHITLIKATQLAVTNTYKVIKNYSKDLENGNNPNGTIINWINNPSSVTYTITSNPDNSNIDEANYTYNISSSASNSSSFTSYVSTYQNGIYFGKFQNSQNS